MTTSKINDEADSSIWHEVMDPKYNRPYYYNKLTKESTWTKPGRWKRQDKTTSNSILGKQGLEDLTEWIQCEDSAYGRPYYYNRQTRRSSWTHPANTTKLTSGTRNKQNNRADGSNDVSKTAETLETIQLGSHVGDFMENHYSSSSSIDATEKSFLRETLMLGNVVKIKNVRSNPLLNGMIGPVVAISDRIKVMIGGKTLSFRYENLEQCEPGVDQLYDFRMNRKHPRKSLKPPNEHLELEFVQTYDLEFDDYDDEPYKQPCRDSKLSTNSENEENIPSEVGKTKVDEDNGIETPLNLVDAETEVTVLKPSNERIEDSDREKSAESQQKKDENNTSIPSGDSLEENSGNENENDGNEGESSSTANNTVERNYDDPHTNEQSVDEPESEESLQNNIKLNEVVSDPQKEKEKESDDTRSVASMPESEVYGNKSSPGLSISPDMLQKITLRKSKSERKVQDQAIPESPSFLDSLKKSQLFEKQASEHNIQA